MKLHIILFRQLVLTPTAPLSHSVKFVSGRKAQSMNLLSMPLQLALVKYIGNVSLVSGMGLTSVRISTIFTAGTDNTIDNTVQVDMKRAGIRENKRRFMKQSLQRFILRLRPAGH